MLHVIEGESQMFVISKPLEQVCALTLVLMTDPYLSDCSVNCSGKVPVK
jgi:hypothetical protein